MTSSCAAEDGACIAHYLIAVFCGRWLAGEPVPGGDELAARFVAIEDIDDAARYRLTDGAARSSIAPGRSCRRPTRE